MVRSNMFNVFMNDTVALVKRDGRRFDNLPASVQAGLIMTQNPNIPIEDGDTFERRLPTGVVESYTVLDAGYKAPFHGIPAHYQSKVQKGTAMPRPRATPHHVVYNLIGPNARVNIQSTDASTNVVNADASAVFDDLRRTVQQAIEDSSVSTELLQRIDGMQAAIGSPGFARRYKDFIAVAADHLTLLAPFLPALTQMLIG